MFTNINALRELCGSKTTARSPFPSLAKLAADPAVPRSNLGILGRAGQGINNAAGAANHWTGTNLGFAWPTWREYSQRDGLFWHPSKSTEDNLRGYAEAGGETLGGAGGAIGGFFAGGAVGGPAAPATAVGGTIVGGYAGGKSGKSLGRNIFNWAWGSNGTQDGVDSLGRNTGYGIDNGAHGNDFKPQLSDLGYAIVPGAGKVMTAPLKSFAGSRSATALTPKANPIFNEAADLARLTTKSDAVGAPTYLQEAWGPTAFWERTPSAEQVVSRLKAPKPGPQTIYNPRSATVADGFKYESGDLFRPNFYAREQGYTGTGTFGGTRGGGQGGLSPEQVFASPVYNYRGDVFGPGGVAGNFSLQPRSALSNNANRLATGTTIEGKPGYLLDGSRMKFRHPENPVMLDDRVFDAAVRLRDAGDLQGAYKAIADAGYRNPQRIMPRSNLSKQTIRDDYAPPRIGEMMRDQHQMLKKWTDQGKRPLDHPIIRRSVPDAHFDRASMRDATERMMFRGNIVDGSTPTSPYRTWFIDGARNLPPTAEKATGAVVRNVPESQMFRELYPAKGSNIYGGLGRFDVPMSAIAPVISSGLHSTDSAD